MSFTFTFDQTLQYGTGLPQTTSALATEELMLRCRDGFRDLAMQLSNATRITTSATETSLRTELYYDGTSAEEILTFSLRPSNGYAWCGVRNMAGSLNQYVVTSQSLTAPTRVRVALSAVIFDGNTLFGEIHSLTTNTSNRQSTIATKITESYTPLLQSGDFAIFENNTFFSRDGSTIGTLQGSTGGIRADDHTKIVAANGIIIDASTVNAVSANILRVELANNSLVRPALYSEVIINDSRWLVYMISDTTYTFMKLQ